MAKPAAMPVFGDAYIADTRHLSLEEHGAYWLLLLIAWRSDDCALPDDDKRLAQMLGISPAKWARLKPTIMAFWTLSGGRWTQKKQREIHKFVAEKRTKNVEAAKSRWNGQATENKGSGRSERKSERTSERISQTDASQTQTNKKKDPSDPKKHAIPQGWKPEPFGEGTQCRGIVDGWAPQHLATQVERFTAHHTARRNKFSDWQAAWKTWVLNSTDFAKPKPQTGGASDPYLDHHLEQRRLRQEWENRAAAGGPA